MTERAKISKGLKPRGICRANARQRGSRAAALEFYTFYFLTYHHFAALSISKPHNNKKAYAAILSA